jgi:hypothetical protein
VEPAVLTARVHSGGQARDERLVLPSAGQLPRCLARVDAGDHGSDPGRWCAVWASHAVTTGH